MSEAPKPDDALDPAPKPRRRSRKKAPTASGDATIEQPAVVDAKPKRRKDVPSASSPDALARMKRQKGEGTKPELLIQAALEAEGLTFEVQAKVVPGVRRRADIVFREAKIAVFVDGCFWHACPVHATWPKANAEWWKAKIEGNQRRDRDTDQRLAEAGWKVVRIWECEAANPITAVHRVGDAGILLAKSSAR